MSEEKHTFLAEVRAVHYLTPLFKIFVFQNIYAYF